jgi:ribosomal protein S18 acetylase RimI-like enzyme
MRVEDAEYVAALVRAAFAVQPVRLNPPPSALKLTEAAVAAVLAGGGGGAVAEANGVIVGSVLWEQRNRAAARDGGLYVSRLSIEPDWRRRGIAGALLDLTERAARCRGVTLLFLETRLALAGNRRLFEAHGYREVSRSAHPGFAEPTSVLMEKRLQAG